MGFGEEDLELVGAVGEAGAGVAGEDDELFSSISISIGSGCVLGVTYWHGGCCGVWLNFRAGQR